MDERADLVVARRDRVRDIGRSRRVAMRQLGDRSGHPGQVAQRFLQAPETECERGGGDQQRNDDRDQP
ncbi:hypothetical protein D9M68_587150 [compost metagenome]